MSDKKELNKQDKDIDSTEKSAAKESQSPAQILKNVPRKKKPQLGEDLERRVSKKGGGTGG